MRLLVLVVSLAAILGVIAWTEGTTGSTLIKHADPVGRVKLLTDYQSNQAVLLPQAPGTLRGPSAGDQDLAHLLNRTAELEGLQQRRRSRVWSAECEVSGPRSLLVTGTVLCGAWRLHIRRSAATARFRT